MLFTALLLASGTASLGQNYTAQVQRYQHQYVQQHEVVKGKDKDFFRFYAIDSSYRVTAAVQRINDVIGFDMPTSNQSKQTYFRYGKIRFSIGDTTLELTLYQSKALMASKEYANYLFIPFTDATSGDESYGGGRYLDIESTDIHNNQLTIDFNKAYNPYCAYAAGYHCPIPPAENHLNIPIKAGEKTFAKPVH